MAAEDRLQKQITLISPKSDGERIYTAKWIGDPITKEKKLGLFDSPKIKGTRVQDLEIKGAVHQYTIFFDDEIDLDDYDLVAKDFWNSLDANGPWVVVHPLYGRFENMYLSTVSWDVKPVTDGFATFTTNWVEGLPDGEQRSLVEIQDTLLSNAETSNDDSANQFENNVKVSTFEQFAAVAGSAQKALNEIKKNLKRIQNLQLINPRIEAFFRGISSLISDFENFDTQVLTSQFVGLFNAIGQAQNDVSDAITNFVNFTQNLGEVSNSDTGQNGKNAASTRELMLNLANAEIAKAVLLPGISTRDDVIEVAGRILSQFTSYTNELDDIAEGFLDSPIEVQYISQETAFFSNYRVALRAVEYLLSLAADLKIEKRFTTRIERSALEIAWDELGGPGDQQDDPTMYGNYADFCEWNDLHGDDGEANVLIIPGGTEVRVFI